MNTIGRSIVGLTGVALTVPLVYLFDPDNGRQRRSALNSQYQKAVGKLKDQTQSAREQLSSRYGNVSTRARSWLDARSRTDQALARSVRMHLWRAIPSSARIGVVAHNGNVILHGEVLAPEQDHVLDVVRAVPGVSSVADHLSPVSTVAPQKVRSRVSRGFAIARDNLVEPHWTLTTRACSGAVALALIRWGSRHRNVYGGLVGFAGVLLVARSVFNTPLRRLATRGKRVVNEDLETNRGRASRAGDGRGASVNKLHEPTAGAT